MENMFNRIFSRKTGLSISKEESSLNIDTVGMTEDEREVIMIALGKVLFEMGNTLDANREVGDKYITGLAGDDILKLKLAELHKNKKFLDDARSLFNNITLNMNNLRNEIIRNDIVNNTMRRIKRNKLIGVLTTLKGAKVAFMVEKLRREYSFGIATSKKSNDKGYEITFEDTLYIYMILKTLVKKFKKIAIALKYEKAMLQGSRQTLKFSRRIDNKILERLVSDRLSDVNSMLFIFETAKRMFEDSSSVAKIETKRRDVNRYETDDDEEDDDLKLVEDLM